MCCHYDKSFILRGRKGNNSFSLDSRKLYSHLHVSSLEKSSDLNIKESESVAFSEFYNDVEVGYKGIEPFLLIEANNKNIYVFDNHNHAFYFIYKEIFENRIPLGLDMIHIDQHKDTRTPEFGFSTIKDKHEKIKEFLVETNCIDMQTIDYKGSLLDAAFYYTNAILNVGNFIKPLLEESLIDKLYIVDSTYTLDQIEKEICASKGYILDIDLDFFSKDMDYIEEEKKISTINKLSKNAALITICTSPFFIEFDKAKAALDKLDLIKSNI